MGVSGLLNVLKSIVKQVHVSEYKGLRVGVDAHCWLHRAGYSCSKELTEGKETSKFICFFMDLLDVLVSNGAIPVVVFDGRPLPAKAATNKTRRASRKENMELAREAEADGRLSEAYSLYQKSVSEMVFQLIKTLRKRSIEFIVSPYESDAQLAFLSLSGYCDVVLTEDSDALVYGCRRVLYKFDKNGFGQEIRRRSLGANQSLSFLNWSDDQFKLMCCLAGCDYAPKIRNIGIVTAHRIVAKHKTFSKVCDALRMSTYAGIDDSYFAKLRMAMNTFKHQTVYNPIDRTMQPLTPFRSDVPASQYYFHEIAGTAVSLDKEQRVRVDGLAYLGEVMCDEVSVLLSEGKVHPNTLQPVPDSHEETEEVEDETVPRSVSMSGSASEVVWTADPAIERTVQQQKQPPSSEPARSLKNMYNSVTMENKDKVIDSRISCREHNRRRGGEGGVGGGGGGNEMWTFNFAADRRANPYVHNMPPCPIRQLEAIAKGDLSVFSKQKKSSRKSRAEGTMSRKCGQDFKPIEMETLHRRRKRQQQGDREDLGGQAQVCKRRGGEDEDELLWGEQNDIPCYNGGKEHAPLFPSHKANTVPFFATTSADIFSVKSPLASVCPSPLSSDSDHLHMVRSSRSGNFSSNNMFPPENEVQKFPFRPKENCPMQRSEAMWSGVSDNDDFICDDKDISPMGCVETNGLGVCTSVGIIKYRPAPRKDNSSNAIASLSGSKGSVGGFVLPKKKPSDEEACIGPWHGGQEEKGNEGSQFGMAWGSFEDRYYCT